MRAWAALVLVLAACETPGPYVCASNDDCGDGFCESDGNCSVADPACPSGRRYGTLSGASAGMCVDGDLPDPTVDETALCGVTGARPDGTSTCAARICADDPSCCEISWDLQCARAAEARCDLACEEIVAAGGYAYAAAFSLDTPRMPVWTTSHVTWLHSPAWGDIEGDGFPDLAIARDGDASTASVVILQGSGLVNGSLILTPATITGDAITRTENLEWRDFDADGDLDLLASGPEGIWIVVTAGVTFTAHRLTGNPAAATWLATSAAPPWRIGVVYDVEPNAEVVIHTVDAGFALASSTSLGMLIDRGVPVWCHVTGTPARDLLVGGNLYIANATGFAAVTTISGSGFFPACADLDGDGDNDVVLGDYGHVQVIENQNGLTTEPFEIPFVYAAGISIADFDNNGRLDVLVSSGTSDRVEIPLTLLDNTATGFERRDILPDWNTMDLDSREIDIGRPPRAAPPE